MTDDVYVGVRYTPGEEEFAEMLFSKNHLDQQQMREYLCEVCGTEDRLTEQAAFNAGWDYPPFIGKWGIVSPRTCPKCPMTNTAWWWIIRNGTDSIPENHMNTIQRILRETP